MTSSLSFRLILTALVLAALSFFLRIPTIGAGMPYFTQEDEAHHFNRTVRMVQSGEFNPKYFHKPSLHFYLRMPVVAGSFLWKVKEGEIRKIEEIRTKDDFGLGDYAFSASHPGIVKANRAFSVLLHLATLLFVIVAAWVLFESLTAAFFSGLLFSISPNVFLYSTTIGVDVVVTFFAAATLLAGLLCAKRFSRPLLFWTALLAGLTVSSKYNALPIVLIPLVLVRERNGLNWSIALLVPWLGFLLGSPFILAEIPLFLNQLAYEIWHYGVVGHAGQMAEPGLPQAAFYLNWLLKEGLGFGAGLAALLGFLLLLVTCPKRSLPLTLFAAAFILLMVFQKTNFTRNMLLVMPALVLIAAAPIAAIAKRLPAPVGPMIALVFAAILSAHPLLTAAALRAEVASAVESRHHFSDWVKQNPFPSPTAIHGELQLDPQLYGHFGVEVIDFEEFTDAALHQQGYRQLVYGGAGERDFKGFKLSHTVKGIAGAQRIVRDPEILVYDLEDRPLNDLKRLALSDQQYQLDIGKLAQEGVSSCSSFQPNAPEEYCWTVGTLTKLQGSPARVFELQSPWGGQSLTLLDGELEEISIIELGVGEDWQSVLFPAETAYLLTEQLGQPGEDPRRIGVAIRLASADKG